MITAALWAAPFLVLAGCGAYSAAVLRGHRPGPGRAARLRRHAATGALTVTTLALVIPVRAAQAARHPLRYAGYLAARAVRRIPRRDPDGERLDRDEFRAFIGLVEIFRHPATPAERSRT